MGSKETGTRLGAFGTLTRNPNVSAFGRGVAGQSINRRALSAAVSRTSPRTQRRLQNDQAFADRFVARQLRAATRRTRR